MFNNKMFDKKVQQLGNELGVSEKDLADIRRARLKRKLWYAAVGAIIVACSAGIGFLAGTASRDSGGYPYAAPGLALVAGPIKRKRGLFVLVTVLLTVVGAVAAGVAAYKAGQHSSFHFGGTAMYSAFSRQK